jgi:mRNA interferase RelE/StbE
VILNVCRQFKDEVQILPKAARQIKALAIEVCQDISLTIQSLAKEPRPIWVKKLSGEKDIYRVRVGNYRVLYRIVIRFWSL